MKQFETVPVFFACDEHYVPYLAVAIRSLVANASPARSYRIHVLNTGISPAHVKRIEALAIPHVEIVFIDMQEAIAPVAAHFSLRDYYTFSIYYRLFIPSMFPQYDRAVYLDCDLVVDSDIADLYDTDLGDSLAGVVTDRIVEDAPPLQTYVEEAVGVPASGYFNSGVMLLNLSAFREAKVEQTFVDLLTAHAFPTVAPDQDYLNYICCGRVTYLPRTWNLMYSAKPTEETPRIIHYNMFLKPWRYDGVPFADRFWHYAKEVDYYPEILAGYRNYSEEAKAADALAGDRMVTSAAAIIIGENTFAKVLGKKGMEATV